jgi:hypothetical protein
LFVFWYHSPNFLDTPHTLCLLCYIRYTYNVIVLYLLTVLQLRGLDLLRLIS